MHSHFGSSSWMMAGSEEQSEQPSSRDSYAGDGALLAAALKPVAEQDGTVFITYPCEAETVSKAYGLHVPNVAGTPTQLTSPQIGHDGALFGRESPITYRSNIVRFGKLGWLAAQGSIIVNDSRGIANCFVLPAAFGPCSSLREGCSSC